MVDALIGKGLCKLGIHGVRWTYRQIPQALTWNDSVSALQLRELRYSVCHQDGVCRRCGVKRSRMHHDWGYPTSGSRRGRAGGDHATTERGLLYPRASAREATERMIRFFQASDHQEIRAWVSEGEEVAVKFWLRTEVVDTVRKLLSDSL